MASGLTAINVTLGYVAGAGEPFEYTVAEIGTWDARLRTNAEHLLKVYSAADILRARSEGFPFVVDLRGVGQFRELANRLERRGYTTDRIEKILGRNFLSYAREIWGA